MVNYHIPHYILSIKRVIRCSLPFTDNIVPITELESCRPVKIVRHLLGLIRGKTILQFTLVARHVIGSRPIKLHIVTEKKNNIILVTSKIPSQKFIHLGLGLLLEDNNIVTVA